MPRIAEEPFVPVSRGRALAQVVATALAYYLVGRFALGLSMPTDPGPAISPAAGVALAAVLLTGARAAFGIFLGAVALHSGYDFGTLAAATSMRALAAPLLEPALVGAGAAFQAWMAAFLVRQFAAWPRSLTGDSNVLRFLLLAGPASCLVAPTVGVGGLVVAGALPTAEIPTTWCTWWVADTTGTTLFAPLILIWCARRHRLSLERRGLVTIPVCIASALALGFHVVSGTRERDRVRAEFARRADDFATRLGRAAEESLEPLATLGSFLDAARDVESEEFGSFAQDLLRRHRAIHGLAWSARESVAPNGVTSAGESFPVEFAEPPEQPRLAPGVDLSADPEVRAALTFARETGELAVTSPVRVRHGAREELAVFAFRPVFRDARRDFDAHADQGGTAGDAAAESPRLPGFAGLRGFAAAVIRLDEAFEDALASVDLDGIGVEVHDLSAEGAVRAFFALGPKEPLGSRTKSGTAFVAPISMSHTLAGRQWEMRFRLSPAYLAAHRSWMVWSVSVGSLLFTSLLAAFLIVVTGRTETVEQVVAGRTTELEQANFRLRHQIAERIRAEEQHRESEHRFEAAQQVAHLGSWEWDVATGAIAWSDELFRVHGLAPGSMPIDQAELLRRVHPDDRAMVGSTFEHAARDRKPFEFAYRIQRPDGAVRILHARGEVGTDATGKTARMHGTGQDVTELKEAERQLARRSAELERSNAELERFAYVASHDLQEPLRAVASHVQMLQQDYLGQLDDEADECIRAAVEGAQRMHDLINDYLAYSRLSSSSEPRTSTSAEAALSTAIKDLRPSIDAAKASVTHDVLPEVTADAVQLALLFHNLVANAVKFRGEEPPRVHVSVARADGSWLFSVKDNGIGIDPEQTGRIFSLFQRLHPLDRYPGTGIGLAICRKIVEGHGGRIWVESMPGMGATFWFTLPGAVPAPLPSRVAETAPARVAESAPSLVAESAPARDAESAPARDAESAPARDAESAPARDAESAPARVAESAPARVAESAPSRVAETAPAHDAESAPARAAESAPARDAESAPSRDAEAAPAGVAETAPAHDAEPDVSPPSSARSYVRFAGRPEDGAA